MVRGRTRAAEPEAIEDDGLNLKALKEKKISDLALIGKNFNIEGAANMRKQELFFQSCKRKLKRTGIFMAKGCWKPCQTVLAFSGRLITITFPGQTISMFLRV